MSSDDKTIFARPEAMTDVVTHYCPGCTHGVIHRLVAEAIDSLGVREITVGVAPVGCSVLAYNYFNTDFLEAPHGRAPALATGFKRSERISRHSEGGSLSGRSVRLYAQGRSKTVSPGSYTS